MSRLQAIVLAVLSLGWCDALNAGTFLHFYSPVKVAVYDAETDAPIANAKAEVTYPPVLLVAMFSPKPDSATTDDHGAATVRAAIKDSPHYTVSAIGYMLDWNAEVRKDVSVYHLYKLPLPQITIVVPNGFHGPLKIEMHSIAGPKSDQFGKRKFAFHTSPLGYVRFDATPLLLLARNDFRVIYEDGRPVREEDFRLGPSDVGLRWVAEADVGQNLRFLYMIGTLADKEAFAAAMCRPIEGDPHNITKDSKAFDAMFAASQSASSESSRQ